MEKEILIFGHKNPDTDSICSSIVKQKLNEQNGHNNSVAVRLGKINKETKFVLDYLKMEEPKLVEKVEEGQKVILVDHNEFGQSVEGIEKAKIIGIVDHHRIANMQTAEPIFMTVRPYACTSTLLFQDYIQKGFEISKEEAILMLSAIVSDTLLFKSPTTTKHDIKAFEELEKIAGIDGKEYGLAMLKAGTNLDEFTAKELINIDSKTSEKDGVKFAIAQVNTVSIEDVLKKQTEIEAEINLEINENNYEIYIFVITDILNSNSEIIVLGKKALLAEKAFNIKLESNRAFLSGVVSRKKQILPQINDCI